MKDRWGLIQKGLFPETLPPCFTSHDLKRGYSGLVKELKRKEMFAKREADYVRYNGTKHDGSRRYFGSPNPISYFYVSDFIARHWKIFDERFDSSPFTVSAPSIGGDDDDRPVIIPSLSELTTIASKKLGRSPYVLKTDISQFFPSVYSHSISWSAHGIDTAKADQAADSVKVFFNRLDLFVRNCQMGETRGVLVGPDAFRLISEFIACEMDAEISKRISSFVIGAARHVDDYYIGISSEVEALSALSSVRDVLQRYHLQVNDAKTRTMRGVDPLNDIWAQRLRREVRNLRRPLVDREVELIVLLNDALEVARTINSDSPVKIAVRTLDETKIYLSEGWADVEPYLQRIMYHHPHCIDYVSLLVAKRFALSQDIDQSGWSDVCADLMAKQVQLNHHHEVVWLFWLAVVTGLTISNEIIGLLTNNRNSHIQALIVAAYTSGRIERKPSIRLGPKPSSTDDQWLLNLVARSTEYSKAPFSGALSAEFEHLAGKAVRLIDFEAHMKSLKQSGVQAISRTRYGYDGDDEEDHDLWV